MLLRALICLVLLIASLAPQPAPAQTGAAQPDVAGSRDPDGIDRYPRSWIVDYRLDDDVRPRNFVMSRVDRIRREMRIEEQLRVDAALESVTYRIPDGVGVDAVEAHFADLFGGDVLFRCAGRSCGRSNDWANQIFEQAVLYGPDANQRYSARQWRDRLVALYVVERGNQRVYAHLDILTPEGPLALEPNALLVRRLSQRGWSVIDGVTPRPDGALDRDAPAVLADVGRRLARLPGRRVLVVCHLGGAGSPEAALAASSACARRAAELIGSSGAAASELVPFGAGPALPRPDAPAARLELVVAGDA
tara:strand:- start:643 stop:1560 length:918 start_codon:yes stop_codon:yes gene_type:complete